jgi:4-carboxymuconolactone decarboxylase
MNERMPALPEGAMNEAQRKATAALIAGPRKAVFGPFVALMRSPELLDRVQRVGEYLRFQSAVPAKLGEFATLIVARHSTNQFEWAMHHPLAIKAGIARETVDALEAHVRPATMADDEAVTYDFITQLLATHRVDDANYARAIALLGEQGVLDLIGLIGYFGMINAVMNVSGTPPPANGVRALPEVL